MDSPSSSENNSSRGWLTNLYKQMFGISRTQTPSSSQDSLNRLEAQTPVPSALKTKDSPFKSGRIQMTDMEWIEVISPPVAAQPSEKPSRREMMDLRRLAERARVYREIYHEPMPEKYMQSSPPELTVMLDRAEEERRRRKELTRQLNQMLGRVRPGGADQAQQAARPGEKGGSPKKESGTTKKTETKKKTGSPKARAEGAPRSTDSRKGTVSSKSSGAHSKKPDAKSKSDSPKAQRKDSKAPHARQKAGTSKKTEEASGKSDVERKKILNLLSVVETGGKRDIDKAEKEIKLLMGKSVRTGGKTNKTHSKSSLSRTARAR